MHDNLFVYALSIIFLNDTISTMTISFLIFLSVCIALLTLFKKWSDSY